MDITYDHVPDNTYDEQLFELLRSFLKGRHCTLQRQIEFIQQHTSMPESEQPKLFAYWQTVKDRVDHREHRTKRKNSELHNSRKKQKISVRKSRQHFSGFTFMNVGAFARTKADLETFNTNQTISEIIIDDSTIGVGTKNEHLLSINHQIWILISLL